MDFYIPNDWPEVDAETFEVILGNLRIQRVAFANGERYLADGYGAVGAHQIEGDKFFLHSRFRKEGSAPHP